jgi:hydroxypyruvate isomerase
MKSPTFRLVIIREEKNQGTGEINYRNVFKYIDGKGFKGVLGMEHGNAMPGKEGELALIKAYREADKFK